MLPNPSVTARPASPVLGGRRTGSAADGADAAVGVDATGAPVCGRTGVGRFPCWIAPMMLWFWNTWGIGARPGNRMTWLANTVPVSWLTLGLVPAFRTIVTQ